MTWLLANWKAVAVGGLSLFLLFVGWEGRVWYDAYHIKKQEVATIDSLGKGQTAIIKFNQDFDKEKSNVKDNCIDKPIPTNVIRLLE